MRLFLHNWSFSIGWTLTVVLCALLLVSMLGDALERPRPVPRWAEYGLGAVVGLALLADVIGRFIAFS